MSKGRPDTTFRYTFEHFVDWFRAKGLPDRKSPSIVPIAAAADGDQQVLAEGLLDRLADFPSVMSIVATGTVRAERDLPHIRELLLTSSASIPDTATLRHLTGLEAFYALLASGVARLDLNALPAAQMRKLALNRWVAKDLRPLEGMTGLKKLRLELFREPLEVVAKMAELEYLWVTGPAKGWAGLRECRLLEEGHFIQVQMANLRKWNTWQRLRVLSLGGRGLKSLAGIESCERVGQLTLLNLPMADLSPLRQLPALESLTLRMVDDNVDLSSAARIPNLRRLILDSSTSETRDTHLPSVRMLAPAAQLQEIVLSETVVEDGDLMPLAELPNLRRLRLGSNIGGDVEKLRAARPDLEIQYTPPDPKWAARKEQVGPVTITRPREGMDQWSIFESLAGNLGAATNYDAERRIRSEVKRRDPELAKRLDWDTEAGAVGIYAKAEQDIRTVAAILGEMIRKT